MCLLKVVGFQVFTWDLSAYAVEHPPTGRLLVTAGEALQAATQGASWLPDDLPLVLGTEENLGGVKSWLAESDVSFLVGVFLSAHEKSTELLLFSSGILYIKSTDSQFLKSFKVPMRCAFHGFFLHFSTQQTAVLG